MAAAGALPVDRVKIAADAVEQVAGASFETDGTWGVWKFWLDASTRAAARTISVPSGAVSVHAPKRPLPVRDAPGLCVMPRPGPSQSALWR